MPLFTTDIGEAAVAYSALEARATAAELHAATLKQRLDEITIHEPLTLRDSRVLGDNVLAQIAKNADLQRQREKAIASKADVTLEAFVAGIATTFAIAENTMPDRAITSASASIKSSLVLDGGSVGLRLWQPEIGDMVMSTITFAIAKVPPAGNAAAPRLFVVLQNMLTVFGTPFWTSLPATPPILVAASQLLAGAGSWTFSSIVTAAQAIGTNAAALAASGSLAAPAGALAEFRAAAAGLTALADGLSGKATPVAGDVYALVAALAAATAAANALAP